MSINYATTSLQAGRLFSVQGLVAVITGGGSGDVFDKLEIKQELTSLRHWSNDGKSTRSK